MSTVTRPKPDTVVNRRARSPRARPIPIRAAARIAQEYGYDQVYIIGRRVGPGGLEHVTTYGVDREHCAAAAIGAAALKRFMGWPEEHIGGDKDALTTEQKHAPEPGFIYCPAQP